MHCEYIYVRLYTHTYIHLCTHIWMYICGTCFRFFATESKNLAPLTDKDKNTIVDWTWTSRTIVLKILLLYIPKTTAIQSECETLLNLEWYLSYFCITSHLFQISYGMLQHKCTVEHVPSVCPIQFTVNPVHSKAFGYIYSSMNNFFTIWAIQISSFYPLQGGVGKVNLWRNNTWGVFSYHCTFCFISLSSYFEWTFSSQKSPECLFSKICTGHLWFLTKWKAHVLQPGWLLQAACA